MPSVGFEPTIPASAWLNAHTLDCAAAGIGLTLHHNLQNDEAVHGNEDSDGVDAEVIANQRVCCWTCRDWTCTDIMTLLIVVYLLCEGTCAACKACLISEALSPTDVNIGFKACRSTVKSLTYPTEKLVETVGAAVIVLEGMMLEVAHLETVKSSITDAIKESVNFDRIRLTGCSLHHQRLEDAIVRGVTRIGSWWKRSVVLNAVSKKNTALPIIQFSQHDISIHASLLLCILW